MKDIFSEFLLLRPQEGNWGDKIHEKYDQMWTQLSSCDPNITLETLDQSKVQELVGWYIRMTIVTVHTETNQDIEIIPTVGFKGMDIQ
mgnify:CR=1 FL=1